MSKPLYKKCAGCRAFGTRGVCDLGYTNKPIHFGGIGGPVINAVPMEACPKPKTVNELVSAPRKK